MTARCRVRFARPDFDLLRNHLFPGDGDEHGAVLLAGVSDTEHGLELLVREVHLAKEGADYIEGSVGYRALSAPFIHRLITRARDQHLAYLAVHNHMSDRRVDFSRVDLDSHERGYPALLQIARGMPVGALVFGTNSAQADVWLPDGTRLELEDATIVGRTIQRMTPAQNLRPDVLSEVHERQIRMFGAAGQSELAHCRVGIVGLGGIGSLVAEYLARLGVGHFCLIDADRVETTNLSRIVGASHADALDGVSKIAVARRMILQANENADVTLVPHDVASESAALQLTACDYLFLAADSMRARLVFNAIVHQYLIPGVQLGSKIRSDSLGSLLDVMSVNRQVRPGRGCLWCNQLIDSTQLAKESKTDDERRAQAYGVEEPNPSVISLNAISASHAVNDFLLDYLDLREDGPAHYEHFFFLRGVRNLVEPRKDADCPECSSSGKRYARGKAVDLPCFEG